MKNKNLAYIIFPVVLGLGFAFNNCAKSNLEAPPEEKEMILASSSPYVLMCSQQKLTQQKLSLSATGLAEPATKIPDYFSDPQMAGAFNIDAEYIVLADNECLKRTPAQSFISQRIVALGLREDMQRFAYRFKFAEARSFREIETAMEQDSCLSMIDFNQKLSSFALNPPNDPVYNTQGMPNLSTIGLGEIFGSIYNANNGINTIVRVAVIDSGVDVNHADLKDNILKTDTGKIVGYNPMAGFNPADFTDAKYHGTHVAGTIAANTGNSLGVAGVMGKFVKIIPIKVSIDGTAVDMDAVVNGIRWSVEQDVDVINMSLGGLTVPPNGSNYIYGQAPVPQLIKDAIKYAIQKGITIVVASGNNGYELGTTTVHVGRASNGANYNYYNNQYPAILGKDYPGLITVGSIDGASYGMSFFSNYSGTYVEMMAPGSKGCVDRANMADCAGIYSTVPAFLAINGYANGVRNANGSVSPIVGTSMASPVVAGAAAMLIGLAKSRGYDIYPEQVEEILLASAPTKLSSSIVKNGKAIDLRTLVAYVDQQTNLDINSAKDRKDAYGVAKILNQPVVRQQVAEGAKAEISVVLTGDSSKLISFQWYKNNRPIYGANRPSLIIEKTSKSDGAQYYVMVRAGTVELQSTRSDLVIAEKCN